MAEYAKTIDDLARRFKTTRQTVYEWKRKGNFPEPTKRNGWNVDKVDAWCKDHSCGPYRKAGGAGDSEGDDGGDGKKVSLHEATRLKTLAQAESERIKAENAAVEQAKLFATILDLEDVRSTLRQMVATVKACVDGSTTALDRSMPEGTPSEAAWPEIRSRVLTLAKKLEADIASAMETAW